MAKPSPTHAGALALVALGEAVRSVRQERGLSQEALAHDAGLDRSYLGRFERGEHNLTCMNLLRLARELGLDAGQLLERARL